MRQLYAPATALLAFSYPLTTVATLQMGLPVDVANLLIKAVITVMFVAATLAALHQGRRASGHLWPLYVFFGFYGLRLLYDTLALGIVPPLVSPSYILLYFFGLTLLPAIAVGIAFDPEDVPMLHKWLFWTLILTNVALLYYVMFVGELAPDTLLSGRFEVREDDDVSAVLNPIIVSLMGGILALFVVGRLAIFQKISASAQLFELGLFAIGIANLLIGGSRGPIVGFVAGILVVAAAALYGASKKQQFVVRPRVFLYLTVLTLAFIYIASSRGLSIGVFDRFKDMFDAGGSRMAEERDYIYASAWQDFADSPIFGNSYLTMNGTALPHNAFLEALTSLGFLGGVAFVACSWISARGVWNGVMVRLGAYGYSIALAAVALMAVSMTSGTIGQTPEVWVITALAMCMGSVYRRASPARRVYGGNGAFGGVPRAAARTSPR